MTMRRFPIHAARLAALALAALLAWPVSAAAQGASTAMQQVQLLFVQNGTAMAVEGKTLRLRNVSNSTVFFTDRPVRMAGHIHTRQEFLKLWSEGPDSFAKNPPNATLSFVEANRPDLIDVVVTLRNPRMQGNDLLYDITVVSGTPPAKAGAAVLFIDIFGVWRRHVRRWAVVGTTAAVASASAARASQAQAAQAQQARAAAPAAAAPAPAAAPPAPLPPPGPNAQHTQASATQRLEQLKAMERDGLISATQYQKASQQIINELTQ
jgi:hypothetical protein